MSPRARGVLGGPSRLRGGYGRRVGPGAAPVGRAWRGPRLGGQDARSLEAVGAEVVLPLGSTAPGVGRLLSERVAVLQALERVVDDGDAVAVRRGLLHRRDAVHEPLAEERHGVAVPTGAGEAVLGDVQVAAGIRRAHV